MESVNTESRQNLALENTHKLESNDIIGGSLTTAQSITLTRPPLLKGNTLGYIKTIQRRGKNYMIRASLPSEEDPVESDGTDHMINDLYIETLGMSSSSNRKAGIFKIIYILATMFMIIAGAIIGVLTLDGQSNHISLYIASILGFSITATQTVLSTFAVEKRSVLLKDVSNKLRKISWNINTLQASNAKPEDKMKKLEEYYAEVNELDLAMFDSSITTTPTSKGTNISSD